MLGAGVNYAGPPSCWVRALARPIINKQATWVKAEVMYARESEGESRRWTKSTTTPRTWRLASLFEMSPAWSRLQSTKHPL